MEINHLEFNPQPEGSSPSILVIDDNRPASRHLFQLLVKLGYAVTGEVNSMDAALERVSKSRPDLVLLDKALLEIENKSFSDSKIWEDMDIPVVLLVNNEQEARQIILSGGCHYGTLIKPANSQDIRTTIEVALQKHALEQKLQATLKHASQFYDFAPIIMFSFTMEGQILDVNRQWTSSLGYTLEESLNQDIGFLLSPESARNFRDMIMPDLLECKRVREIRLDYIRRDGSIMKGILDASFEIEWQGEPIGLAVVRDITEGLILQEEENAQRALAEALRETAGLLTSTLNFDEVLDRILETVGSVVPHDAANIMMVWAGMAYVVRFHGYTELDLDEFMLSMQLPVRETPNLQTMYMSGRPVAIENTDLQPEINFQPEMSWRKSLASAPLRSRGVVFGFLNLESTETGFFSQIHAERLQAFADQAAIAIENARLYAEVQQSAITDELTGVYNRRGVLELGRREIERARRYARDLTILMIDIDHFKDVNDNFSHAAGDQVLVEITRRWRETLREVDLLGRIGGDEFCILLPETDLDAAMQVAERLRHGISSRPFETENGMIPLTVSIGVAAVEKEIADLQEMLSRADNAMYSAKKGGRNTISPAGKSGG
jgi:diguanylate cyclase (GGDEF)-like protein/PAS domain S-box-containing protein